MSEFSKELPITPSAYYHRGRDGYVEAVNVSFMGDDPSKPLVVMPSPLAYRGADFVVPTVKDMGGEWLLIPSPERLIELLETKP